MEHTEDATFYLNSDFLSSPFIANMERAVAHGGSHSIRKAENSYMVYNPTLCGFLVSDNVRVHVVQPGHWTDGPITSISGIDYIDKYVEGYQAGVKFFNEEYDVSSSVIYGPSGEKYIETLYHQCLVSCSGSGLGGWKSAAYSLPTTINYDIIRDQAYYAGIYSRVVDLMAKHKIISDALSSKQFGPHLKAISVVPNIKNTQSLNLEASINQKEIASRPGRKAIESKQFNDIWLGEEAQFWEIVRTYADRFIETLDNQISWRKTNKGISFLAGFTAECQKKKWIATGKHSAPTLQKFYQDLFDIKFDQKPFKPNNLNSIDPIYTQPFKGIRYRDMSGQSR